MLVEVSNSNFCKNIHYLRRKKRLSKKALATKARITIDKVEQIEQEDTLLALDYDVLLRFRMIFCCSLDILFHSDLSEA